MRLPRTVEIVKTQEQIYHTEPHIRTIMPQIKIKYTRAFLTGSHAYGFPNVKSDVDLVVLMEKESAQKLELLGEIDTAEGDNYISAGGQSVRFGNLNIILCMNKKYYDVWKKGTEHLKKIGPVSRDFACKYFKKLRKEAGFCV